MTGHRLDATAETTRDVFSRDHPPVLTVDPGDTVTVGSLDASGYLARQTHPGQVQPTMFAEARGHCLTGPIEVRGARPGDMLALRLLSLRPGDWGWTVAGARDTPVTRRLGLAGGPPSWLLWDLDPDAGQGRTEEGFTRSLAPFLGVMGVPRPSPGSTRRYRRAPPAAGTSTAGNSSRGPRSSCRSPCRARGSTWATVTPRRATARSAGPPSNAR